MTYDCGNPDCKIRSSAGKDFEGVVAYAMATLQTVFDLTAEHRVKFSKTSSLTESISSAPRVGALLKFLHLQEQIEKKPFDQALLETSWSLLEGVMEHFDETEKLLFRTSIRPTEPTLAEMAFCRVIDGWKFYLEELSGKPYGSHKAVLQGEEVTLDEVLNETRNLFVHYGGVLGLSKRKGKKHRDIFQTQLSTLSSSQSRIVDLCHHALGLSEGSRVQLGMRETLSYLHEVAVLLEKIEVRQPKTA
jgi:hypothetical protein